MSYPEPSSAGSAVALADALPDRLRAFAGADPVVTVDPANPRDVAGTIGTLGFVHAPFVLQDIADYRGMLQAWFAMLRIGGHLAIEVPHCFLCERELALPSRHHPSRRRLYTPASLLAEVEEALAPNSYRVRLVHDDDEGYDYALDNDVPRAGAQGILLVLERIALPLWVPDTGEVSEGAPPDFAFEPARTRREIAALAPRRRILILKLDHLGDFIMGVPALETARRVFADAEITLVVGSWNHAMAAELGVADTVTAFDAFPRNSSEETVNLAARVPAFRDAIVGAYDLAIDLRTDPDTRFFLQHVDANIRAGLGTRAQFGFLDIFLPIDYSRHGFEATWDQKIEHHAHQAVGECHRSHFRISYDPRDRTAPSQFIVWGPYLTLQVGEYRYEPLIDIAGNGTEVVLIDVAIDEVQAIGTLASAAQVPPLHFSVEKPENRVEFRVFQPNPAAHVGFDFYGGRLLKRGAASVLHQSEYLALLIDLVEMRTRRFGLLRSDASAATS